MLTTIITGVIIVLHLYFLILEMFFWTHPYGRKVFSLSKEFAEQSKVLAANQGLYNGFLAAGLIWGLSLGTKGFGVLLFFLICVAIAGIYGGLTANRKIFFIQAVPAIIALVTLMI